MSRITLNKRIAALEAHAMTRIKAEARNITPERFNEIMRKQDESQRKGEGAEIFFKTLTDGELARVCIDRDEWVKCEAQKMTRDQIAELIASGMDIEHWTEAELCAVAVDIDAGIDWAQVPDDICKAATTRMVDLDDLRRRYPSKGSLPERTTFTT